MLTRKSEKGQALILITFAIIGLIGLTGLTVDGGMAYSDRRNAQNAADSAAFAAALAHSRGQNFTTVAQSVATTNGYDNDGSTNIVAVTSANSPSGSCPAGATNNKDITVQITSHVNTSFSNVVGIQEVTNTVTATTRACGTYIAPLFDGNAIVSLAPSGKGYDATGTPDWDINGGGIFSNSNSCPSVYRNGAASVDVETGFGITTPGCAQGLSGIPTISGSTVPQYSWDEYKSLLPRTPACDGTATLAGGVWQPQTGADGSTVAFSGNMVFTSGLYCVTNSPGPFHGQISGSNVTFYIMNSNFQMKFNGGGNLTATAPTAGDYKGVLMYLAPQVDVNGNLLNTQAIDMRGNGTSDIVGSIIAPSADITMFGNSSSTAGFRSQIIGYQVDSGGTADISISYDGGENYQAAQPIEIKLLK